MNKLTFFTLTFLFLFNNSFSSTNKSLYEKIDLFGEVLEKVKDEYQTKPGKKEKPLYRNVAKDLLSSPKKLTRLEKNALEGFLGKRNMSSAAKRSSIKHLESAMKKHPCFLASSKKNKNMSRWPKADEKALWFTIDCKKQNNKNTN